MSSRAEGWTSPMTADASAPEGNPPSGDADGQNPTPPRGRAAVPVLRTLAVGGPLAVANAGGFADPPLRTVTMAVDLAAAAGAFVVLLVLMIVIVFGSDQRCNRVFRLLRWLANRPEPPAPDSIAAGQRAARPQTSRKATGLRPARSTTLFPASRDLPPGEPATELPPGETATGGATGEDSFELRELADRTGQAPPLGA